MSMAMGNITVSSVQNYLHIGNSRCFLSLATKWLIVRHFVRLPRAMLVKSALTAWRIEIGVSQASFCQKNRWTLLSTFLGFRSHSDWFSFGFFTDTVRFVVDLGVQEFGTNSRMTQKHEATIQQNNIRINSKCQTAPMGIARRRPSYQGARSSLGDLPD